MQDCTVETLEQVERELRASLAKLDGVQLRGFADMHLQLAIDRLVDETARLRNRPQKLHVAR